jgi:TPR repeat protein
VETRPPEKTNLDSSVNEERPFGRPESAKRWTSLVWPMLLLLLALLFYLLSTGPVCRWALPTARKIYSPLNSLVDSTVFRPVLHKWLSAWGAAPWWVQPSPPGRAGQQWFYYWFEDGKAITQINGVPSNVDVAKLKQATESGDAVAQMQLGTCLYDGKHGVVTNYVEAYKWTTIAAANGQQAAKYLVREMDVFLTPKQVADGKAAARSFDSGQKEVLP